jgi:hypothetical protein
MAITFEPLDPNADPFADVPEMAVTEAPVVAAPADAKAVTPTETKVEAPAATATAFEPIDPNADPFADVAEVPAVPAATAVIPTRAEMGEGQTLDEIKARLRQEYADGLRDVKVDDTTLLGVLDYEQLYTRALQPDATGQWLSAILEGRSNDKDAERRVREQAVEAAKMGGGKWRGGANQVWVPAKHEEAVLHEAAGISVMREFVNGMSFELGDEFMAAVESGATGEDFQTVHTRYEKQMDLASRTMPTVSLIANMGGAVAVGIATAGTANLAIGGRAVAAGAKGLFTRETLKQGTVAVTTGAVDNTISGIGSRSGEERFMMDNILSDFAMGATVGGGLVGGVKVVGAVGAPAARAFGAMFGGVGGQKLVGSEAGGARAAGFYIEQALARAGVDRNLLAAEGMKGQYANGFELIAKVGGAEKFAKFMDEGFANIPPRLLEEVRNGLSQGFDVMGASFMDQSRRLANDLVASTDPITVQNHLTRNIDPTKPLTEESFASLIKNLDQINPNMDLAARNDFAAKLDLKVGELADYGALSKKIIALKAETKATGEQLEKLRTAISGNVSFDDKILNKFRSLDINGNDIPGASKTNVIRDLVKAYNEHPKVEASIWKTEISERFDGGKQQRATFTPSTEVFVKKLNEIADVNQRKLYASKVGGLEELADGSFAVRRTPSPILDDVEAGKMFVINADLESLPPDLQKALDDEIAGSVEVDQVSKIMGADGKVFEYRNYVNAKAAQLNGQEVREVVDELRKKKMVDGNAGTVPAAYNRLAKDMMDGLNASDEDVAAHNLAYSQLKPTLDLLDAGNMAKFRSAIENQGSGVEIGEYAETLARIKERPDLFNILTLKYFQDAKSVDDLLNMDHKTLYGLAELRRVFDPAAPSGQQILDDWIAMGKSATTVKEKVDMLATSLGAQQGVSKMLKVFGEAADNIATGKETGANITKYIETAEETMRGLETDFQRVEDALNNGALPDMPENRAALDAMRKQITDIRASIGPSMDKVFSDYVSSAVHGLDIEDLDITNATLDKLTRSSKATDELLRGVRNAGLTDDLVKYKKALVELRNMGKALKIVQTSVDKVAADDFSFMGEAIQAFGVGIGNLGGTNSTVGRTGGYIVGRFIKTAFSGVAGTDRMYRYDNETQAMMKMLSGADPEAMGRYFLPLITGKPATMSMQEFMKKEVMIPKVLRAAVIASFTRSGESQPNGQPTAQPTAPPTAPSQASE